MNVDCVFVLSLPEFLLSGVGWKKRIIMLVNYVSMGLLCCSSVGD